MVDHAPRTSPEIAARDRSRPAVIIAGLLYLIAAHQRSPCPCLAGCIVRHLECLSSHDDVDPVIRQICRSIGASWQQAARGVSNDAAGLLAAGCATPSLLSH